MSATATGVRIELADATLAGDLGLPDRARGLVVFVHGSGSSRHSSRNRFVASTLVDRGFATLLFDLLTEAEDRDDETRFDIPLLTRRLLGVTTWLRKRDDVGALALGYFGASTGAAAALHAAATLQSEVRAVVSRGGRPDLALDSLPRVTAPTLLIVGGADEEVIHLNQQAYAALHCPKELAVVAGATHLFEEPGALDQVAELAGDWFGQHFSGVARPG
ncbi:dienelactone hydrolase family protein [Fontimonas sp. SYSU GA230001]|uniref:dienelactone hydrolase family protein n=1 Tax=Fontimonas sp. SYSU GA230001 TaxID=3142450 RepID=UPI0032B5BBA9